MLLLFCLPKIGEDPSPLFAFAKIGCILRRSCRCRTRARSERARERESERARERESERARERESERARERESVCVRERESAGLAAAGRGLGPARDPDRATFVCLVIGSVIAVPIGMSIFHDTDCNDCNDCNEWYAHPRCSLLLWLSVAWRVSSRSCVEKLSRGSFREKKLNPPFPVAPLPFPAVHFALPAFPSRPAPRLVGAIRVISTVH